MPIPVNEGLINYQQGKGSAFILPGHDFSGLRSANAAIERSQARIHDRLDKQQQRRKKEVDDILNKNYELGAQRDTAAIGGATKEMRDYVSSELAKGNRNVLKAGTPEWQKYKEMEDRVVNSAKNSISENKWVNESIKQIRQSNDPYLDKEKAISTLLDHYYGKDGTKNIFSEDYGTRPNWMVDAFNEGAWMRDFTKDLPERTAQEIKTRIAKDGQYIDTLEATGKFFVMENGKVKVGPDGQPIIQASDETAQVALQDERFRRSIENQLQLPENQDKTSVDLAKEKLKKYGYVDITKDRKKGFAKKNPPKPPAGRTTKEEIFARQEVIERTQKNIEKQFNSLKGGKLPDGKTTIKDVSYDESNSRLYFNGGDYSIDISAENNGGFEELWNIYNTVPGFKKIDVTELMKNKDYQEQYPDFSDRIDYSEKGPLKKDIEKVIDSPASEQKKKYITTLLKNNENVKSVQWDDGMLVVQYHNGNVDRVEIPERKEDTKIDTKVYKNLQDLLLKTNKDLYMKQVDPDEIDFDNLIF